MERVLLILCCIVALLLPRALCVAQLADNEFTTGLDLSSGSVDGEAGGPVRQEGRNLERSGLAAPTSSSSARESGSADIASSSDSTTAIRSSSQSGSSARIPASLHPRHGMPCKESSQRIQCGTLICFTQNHTCGHCSTSGQCESSVEECVAGECVLKPLSRTFGLGTLFSIVSVVVVCGIAVVAGVGGGGILVPVFVALIGLYMGDAVALSQATIAGQAFFNLLMIAGRHHPDFEGPREATRPIINYEYLTLLLPISLAGTLYGAMLGRVVPDWFRVVCLMLLLGGLSIRVVKKAINQFRREASHSLSMARSNSEDSVEESELVSAPKTHAPKTHGIPSVAVAPAPVPIVVDWKRDGGEEVYSHHEFIDDFDDDDESTEALDQYPRKEIGFCATMFVCLLACNYVRENYARCGTPLYWICYVVATGLLCLMFGLVYLGLRRRWSMIQTGHRLDDMPFHWSNRTTLVFPLLAITAGGAAALLGIGGGLVLSTLLFEAKLIPESASATGSVATLLVAAESALQFVFMGQLRFDYGVLFFAAGVLSSVIGQFCLVRPIRKYQWNSMIFCSLSFVLIGSMVALSILGIHNTYDTVQRGGSLGFGSLCHEY